MKTSAKFSLAKRGLLASVAALALCSASIPALAQLEPATRQASPDRVQQQLGDDAFVPSVMPKVEVRDAILQEMPANAASIKFQLNSLTVDGNNVYTANQLRGLYADKLGSTISLADLYALSTALTNKYRNDGYILTQVIVPPQTIDAGNVKLQAVEGFIDRVQVGGNDKETALAQVRKYANQLVGQGAINVRRLEKFLLLINDLPGVEARSILSPSPNVVGASDLQIIVERDPYDAFLGIDNFGSRYLGRTQVTAAGALNSIFGYNERISLQTVVAPDRGGPELYYGDLGVDLPVGSYGTIAKAQYAYTNTEPGFTLSQFDVRGVSEFMSIGLEHPFIRTRAVNLYGHAKFDARDVRSRNDLEATRIDRLRVLRAGVRSEFLDNVIGVGINAIALEASKGLNVLGASEKRDPNMSRSEGDPQFTKATADIQRLQRLSQDFNLLIGARGQLSDGPLLSSEEFGVGGFNVGRGYDPSELVGDEGVAGKLELQWNSPYAGQFVEKYQLFGFYDIGKVWNNDATTSADKKNSLASAGVGVRAEIVQDMKAGLAVAVPLTRDAQTENDQDPRFYMNFSKQF